MIVVDLLPMTLHLPFNHGLPVGYALSRKATTAHAIETWSISPMKATTPKSGWILRSSTDRSM
jgi:hypothetical protein